MSPRCSTCNGNIFTIDFVKIDDQSLMLLNCTCCHVQTVWEWKDVKKLMEITK